MKKYAIVLFVMAAVAACTSDDPLEEYYNGGGGNGSAGGTTQLDGSDMSVELASLDVAIDSTAMDETLDTPDETDEYYEDYVETYQAENTLLIHYNGTDDATVSGSADGVSVVVSGGHVTVTSGAKKMAYVLSGSSADGCFKIYSDYKFQLTLNGVSLTNTSGAAINNQGKRMYLVLADGTTNTLADGSTYSTPADEDEKATLFSEGKLPISGAGRLRVYGRGKNGIASDDYVLLRPQANVYVQSSSGHGIKANDGVIIRGGVLCVEVSAAGKKGINSEGAVSISGGRTTLVATGGVETSDGDYTGAAGLKSDSTLVVSGGTLLCKATGQGGKGISVDQTMNVSGGTIHAVATGSNYGSSLSGRYGSSDSSVKAKAVKTDGDLTVGGGNIMARANSHEGIETKGTLTVTGGHIASYSSDDAINSASHTTISGGYVFACSTGNDGLDANGNLYIKGGNVYAIGSSSPEVAIDANTEGGYKLYVTGGNLVAIGGLESGSSLSQSCYQVGSWSSGSWYALSSGGETVLAFRTPSATSSQSRALVVSTAGTATLVAGITVAGGTTIFGGMGNVEGTCSGGTAVSLSAYSGSNGGGQGGGPGGRR